MENDIHALLIKELKELKQIVLKQNELLEKIVSESDRDHKRAKEISTFSVDIEIKITSLLRELKIPANLKGFFFLRDAVKFVYQDFDLLSEITKGLYPKIARKHNTTPNKVERGIRHAIEVSWYNVEKHDFYSENHVEDRPTNAQLIALVADKIRLEEAACEVAN